MLVLQSLLCCVLQKAVSCSVRRVAGTQIVKGISRDPRQPASHLSLEKEDGTSHGGGQVYNMLNRGMFWDF
jgi:hypothetical protein